MAKLDLELSIASGEALVVQQFSVVERISSLFEVTLVAAAASPDLDIEGVFGEAARLTLRAGDAPSAATRSFSGLCTKVQQLGTAAGGFQLVIHPWLWLLTQERGHRVFQDRSPVDIAVEVLGAWDITPSLRLTGSHEEPVYQAQQGESDFEFLWRVLEEAGISFYFEASSDDSMLVLSDAPEAREARAPLSFVSPFLSPFLSMASGAPREVVTAVRMGLRGSPSPAKPPVEAVSLSERRRDFKRRAARTFRFETNALDLAPGAVLSLLDHPRRELAPGRRLLVVEVVSRGRAGEALTMQVEARSAETRYRPERGEPLEWDTSAPLDVGSERFVAHERSTLVSSDESLTVRKDLSKHVVQNEREVTGLHRTTSVGVNRTAYVGAIDTTVAGERIVAQVAPPDDVGGAATGQVIQHDAIELATSGGAKITLRGAEITLAAESIRIDARQKLLITEDSAAIAVARATTATVEPLSDQGELSVLSHPEHT